MTLFRALRKEKLLRNVPGIKSRSKERISIPARNLVSPALFMM